MHQTTNFYATGLRGISNEMRVSKITDQNVCIDIKQFFLISWLTNYKMIQMFEDSLFALLLEEDGCCWDGTDTAGLVRGWTKSETSVYWIRYSG